MSFADDVMEYVILFLYRFLCLKNYAFQICHVCYAVPLFWLAGWLAD